jgi:hypothetical protein
MVMGWEQEEEEGRRVVLECGEQQGEGNQCVKNSPVFLIFLLLLFISYNTILNYVEWFLFS